MVLPQRKRRRAEGRRAKVKIEMVENQITEIIIGCSIKVHRSLGPGLLESAYEACLFHELSKTGLIIEKQKALPLM